MADLTRTCQHVIRSGQIGFRGVDGVIRCVALADASGYCPVHRYPRFGKPKPKPGRRDRDADVLPWTDADRAVFSRRVRRHRDADGK